MIVLPMPMFLFANVAVVALVSIVTTSFVSMPTSAADPSCKMEVALVLALYTRVVAVTPETVRSLAVTFAVSPVGWVSV